MELQERDRAIMRFISQYKIVTISIIHDIFFQGSKTSEACRKRLQKLSQAGYIQMYKDGFGREHLFRISPREAREVEDQRLCICKFVAKLGKEGYRFSNCQLNVKVGGVTYDWIGIVKKNGKSNLVFLVANLNRPYPNIKIDKSFEQYYPEYQAFLSKNENDKENDKDKVDKILFVAITDLRVMATKHIKPIVINTLFNDFSSLNQPFQ